MKRVCFVMALACLALACGVQPVVQKPMPTVTLVPAKNEEPEPKPIEPGTNRGFGYIHLNLNDGRGPTGHVQEVLAALQWFEKEHPDTYITSYVVDGKYDSYANYAQTFGIWITYTKVAPISR